MRRRRRFRSSRWHQLNDDDDDVHTYCIDWLQYIMFVDEMRLCGKHLIALFSNLNVFIFSFWPNVFCLNILVFRVYILILFSWHCARLERYKKLQYVCMKITQASNVFFLYFWVPKHNMWHAAPNRTHTHTHIQSNRIPSKPDGFLGNFTYVYAARASFSDRGDVALCGWWWVSMGMCLIVCVSVHFALWVRYWVQRPLLFTTPHMNMSDRTSLYTTEYALCIRNRVQFNSTEHNTTYSVRCDMYDIHFG